VCLKGVSRLLRVAHVSSWLQHVAACCSMLQTLSSQPLLHVSLVLAGVHVQRQQTQLALQSVDVVSERLQVSGRCGQAWCRLQGCGCVRVHHGGLACGGGVGGAQHVRQV